MEPAGANLGRFPSKFLLMVIPGLIASGIVALVLYAVHASRAPSSAELLTDLTPQGDGLSTEERRGLTRQMLKARRENPQEPEQVRPTPTSRPATTGLAEEPAADAKAASGAPAAEAKSAPDRAPTAAPLPAARPVIARVRPDSTAAATPATSGAVAPPADASAQSAGAPLATIDPALLPPEMVNPPAGAEAEPQPRGFAANVFSSISVLAGTAVNATGNTVNWVIDLPGKAISAGGKLLGGDSAASNPPVASPPPAAAPPPATAPPPKRNL
jgi:hypothetical protein